MLDAGGRIIINEKGTYDVSGTVYIGSDTTLEFADGTYIRRVPCGDGDGTLMLNKGALSRTYDSNITIRGMRLVCNGVDITKQNIVGMNCQIGFFYAKHTVIENFECLDLEKRGFCIQICTFEDSTIKNVRVEGMKDAVHYGAGRGFVLKDGVFKTFDDPIALNANDYAIANPQMGWIEDGYIENCYDLNQPETTGYFCRLLGGSWLDWRAGMIIRNSDTVIYGGRMYRAKMPPDGKEYISHTPPLHESGQAVADGINWVMTQDDNVIYNCGCRNIRFKNIHLKKNRHTAFAFHFDNDVHSHSCYPYSEAPVQTDITFENVFVEADVPYLIRATTPVGNIKVINSTLRDSSIRFAERGVEGIKYPPSNVTMSGCVIHGKCDIAAAEGRKIYFCGRDNDVSDGCLTTSGNVEII